MADLAAGTVDTAKCPWSIEHTEQAIQDEGLSLPSLLFPCTVVTPTGTAELIVIGYFPTRRQFLKAALGLAVALMGTDTYAFGIEPGVRLRVQRYAPRLRAWPDDLPLRIAALTDIHVDDPRTPSASRP